MHKSVAFLFLLLLVHVSCIHEPLAQDLPSLQGTKWEYSESEIWNDGSFSSRMYLDFRDEEMVVYNYEFEENNGFEIQQGGESFRYIYRYDFSVKQGIFIDENGEGASFELRGNLLFLTRGYSTYIFHRV